MKFTDKDGVVADLVEILYSRRPDTVRNRTYRESLMSSIVKCIRCIDRAIRGHDEELAAIRQSIAVLTGEVHRLEQKLNKESY